MKSILLFIFLLLSSFVRVKAQRQQFSIYEDNDFFNVFGKGTDKAYTNGARLSYYFTRQRPGRLRLPRAGSGSVNTYAISVTQLMFTPNNIASSEYQYSDYPYAGALLLSHSLHSSNPAKHFSFYTALAAGVRGPAALGMEAQTMIHKMLKYQLPKGWKHQQDNLLLLNIGFTAEKQLGTFRHLLELAGGMEVQAGNMINSASVYPLLRIGRMTPYFNGHFSRYASAARNWQCYLLLRPHASYIASNALLQSDYPPAGSPYARKNAPADTRISNWMAGLDYGLVLSFHRFGVSYTQKQTTRYLEGLYGHNVGNLSLYYSWYAK